MNKATGAALLIFGTVLVIYAFIASSPVNSDASSLSAGAPTAKTLGLLLCGSAAMVAGAAMAMKRSGKA